MHEATVADTLKLYKTKVSHRHMTGIFDRFNVPV